MKTSYENILQILQTANVAFKIHEHAPSVTYQDAVDYLDFPLENLVKTIGFRVKEGLWVLAALPGRDRVDYKKLAAQFGKSRDKLIRLEAAEVEEKLGYAVGTVAPFALNDLTVVIIDEQVMRLEPVFCGTGRHDRTLEISSTDLLTLSGGRVAPISQEQSAG